MIFITGANGWLGLNLIQSITSGESTKWGMRKDEITAFILKGTSKDRILNISKNVNIIEGDLSKGEDVKNFLVNANNSIIIHTAGVIHPKRVSEFYKVNRDCTKNLLEEASKSSIKKVVIVSSNSPCGCNPSKKHLFDEKTPYNPYMNYGKSKMEMEILVNEFHSKGLVNSTIIRAPWFYGPFQPPRQKLFFEMIRKGKGPVVGDGENKRSMAYTGNLVQGIILATTKEISNGKTYWIADEFPYTMNYILDTIEKILQNNFNQECNLGRLKLPGIVSDFAEKLDSLIQYVGIYHQKIHVLSEMNKNISCSISLAKEELGYKPEFSLKDGMKVSLGEIY